MFLIKKLKRKLKISPEMDKRIPVNLMKSSHQKTGFYLLILPKPSFLYL
ncbi:hypothetical protein SAMN02787100_3893 [Chryseobacterium sp. OV279]|nr:hypothetical protein SAMN02787100_3893 [Chryseobacterium sp. OV279]